MTLFRNTRPRLPVLRHTRTIVSGTGPAPPAVDPYLLLESGDILLLESGDKLLLESGVNAKLTALTAAALTTDDVFYLADDPGGTPLSKKVTAANLRTYLLA